jgi:hypothetical protein
MNVTAIARQVWSAAVPDRNWPRGLGVYLVDPATKPPQLSRRLWKLLLRAGGLTIWYKRDMMMIYLVARPLARVLSTLLHEFAHVIAGPDVYHEAAYWQIEERIVSAIAAFDRRRGGEG